MPIQSEAEDNLRVIRSLMERATIYRAISAPTALVGGLLCVIACALLYFAFAPSRYEDVVAYHFWFFTTWFAALALTIAANTFFIWRGARQRGEPFISSGMKLALISLLPSMLCAVFFILFVYKFIHASFFLPAVWMLCYGLGLLATSHFAPRSMILLGWVFLVAGFVAFPFLLHCDYTFSGPPNFYAASNFLMGTTFGLFHIIYAACTWPRKSTTINSGGEP
jgi:hypothetical protein